MTQTSDDSPTPLGSLLQLPGAIAAELIGVIPKLADRTRAQVDFAATVIEKLRCGDLGARLGSGGADHLAEVVPFERRVVTAEAPAEADRVPVEVTTLPSSPRRMAAEAPAKKAPAKKAPAKKATSKKAAAKKSSTAPMKASDKKATAKKATAKKATAKKAPARKAPARKAPAKKAPATTAPAVETAAAPEPVTVDALAIPGYDTLAASQVVPRLESLSTADLDAVRRYEQAHRSRHTILSRIAQLQAG